MSVVRFTRVRIRADRVTEFGTVVAGEVLSLLRDQPGCHEAHAMLRGETGVIMSVWGDEAHMRRYEADKYLTLVKKLALLTDDVPYVEVFQALRRSEDQPTPAVSPG